MEALNIIIFVKILAKTMFLRKITIFTEMAINPKLPMQETAHLGQEPEEDSLNVARRGKEDQWYSNLFEDIEGDVEQKFTKPDAIILKFADSEELTRLGVEEFGKDL